MGSIALPASRSASRAERQSVRPVGTSDNAAAAFGSIDRATTAFSTGCQVAKCTWFTCAATRKALAATVKLGFIPALEGKNEVSTT